MLYSFFWVIPRRLKFRHRGITQKKEKDFIKQEIILTVKTLILYLCVCSTTTPQNTHLSKTEAIINPYPANVENMVDS